MIAPFADLGGNGQDIPFSLANTTMAVLLFTPERLSGSANFAGHLDALRAAVLPLPTALVLFASGLAGLGWMSARRRKAQLAL